jgi:membrane dipeptidase
MNDITIATLADHIDHAVQVAGIDHVGIASDFDGGGGVGGWDDASTTPAVTAELSDAAIPKPTSPRSGAAMCCG